MTLLTDFEPVDLSADGYLDDPSVDIEDSNESFRINSVANYKRWSEAFYRVVQSRDGRWFRGTATIRESGEVSNATIKSKISPAELNSDNEIVEFCAEIMRAELTSENQKTDSQRHRDAPAYTITGNVVEITPTDFEVDWLGGDRILISRNLTFGKWNELQVGDWFKGVIVRRNGGEILNATLLSKIPVPEIMSDTQIEAFYSKLKPVRLSPTD